MSEMQQTIIEFTANRHHFHISFSVPVESLALSMDRVELGLPKTFNKSSYQI